MSVIASIAIDLAGIALLLGGESRRLPLQNVVALGMLAPAASLGAAGVARLAGSSPDPLAATALASAWVVLAARPIARWPGPGPTHLFVRTVAFAWILHLARCWPSLRPSPAAAALQLALDPVVLLLLAPWWIVKPLAPRTVEPAWHFAAPLTLAAHALHRGLHGAWAESLTLLVVGLIAAARVPGVSAGAPRPPGPPPRPSP